MGRQRSRPCVRGGRMSDATVLVASGGTRVGSEIDFATPWVRHVLGFMGIAEVEIVAADAMGSGPERLEQAKERIRLLAA